MAPDDAPQIFESYGHDPEVTRRFPKLPGDENTVLLHLPPTA